MDIIQLEAMLKRRGYGKPFIKSMNACYAPGVLVPTEVIEVAVPSYGKDFPICSYHYLAGHTVASMANMLDRQLGVRHRHVMCQCGLPVLRHTHDVVLAAVTDVLQSLPVYQGRVSSDAYEYRLVSAGPESESIKYCPQCGSMLTGSVREIED